MSDNTPEPTPRPTKVPTCDDESFNTKVLFKGNQRLVHNVSNFSTAAGTSSNYKIDFTNENTDGWCHNYEIKLKSNSTNFDSNCLINDLTTTIDELVLDFSSDNNNNTSTSDYNIHGYSLSDYLISATVSHSQYEYEIINDTITFYPNRSINRHHYCNIEVDSIDISICLNNTLMDGSDVQFVRKSGYCITHNLGRYWNDIHTVCDSIWVPDIQFETQSRLNISKNDTLFVPDYRIKPNETYIIDDDPNMIGTGHFRITDALYTPQFYLIKDCFISNMTDDGAFGKVMIDDSFVDNITQFEDEYLQSAFLLFPFDRLFLPQGCFDMQGIIIDVEHAAFNETLILTLEMSVNPFVLYFGEADFDAPQVKNIEIPYFISADNNNDGGVNNPLGVESVCYIHEFSQFYTISNANDLQHLYYTVLNQSRVNIDDISIWCWEQQTVSHIDYLSQYANYSYNETSDYSNNIDLGSVTLTQPPSEYFESLFDTDFESVIDRTRGHRIRRRLSQMQLQDNNNISINTIDHDHITRARHTTHALKSTRLRDHNRRILWGVDLDSLWDSAVSVVDSAIKEVRKVVDYIAKYLEDTYRLTIPIIKGTDEIAIAGVWPDQTNEHDRDTIQCDIDAMQSINGKHGLRVRMESNGFAVTKITEITYILNVRISATHDIYCKYLQPVAEGDAISIFFRELRGPTRELKCAGPVCLTWRPYISTEIEVNEGTDANEIYSFMHFDNEFQIEFGYNADRGGPYADVASGPDFEIEHHFDTEVRPNDDVCIIVAKNGITSKFEFGALIGIHAKLSWFKDIPKWVADYGPMVFDFGVDGIGATARFDIVQSMKLQHPARRHSDCYYGAECYVREYPIVQQTGQVDLELHACMFIPRIERFGVVLLRRHIIACTKNPLWKDSLLSYDLCGDHEQYRSDFGEHCCAPTFAPTFLPTPEPTSLIQSGATCDDLQNYGDSYVTRINIDAGDVFTFDYDSILLSSSCRYIFTFDNDNVMRLYYLQNGQYVEYWSFTIPTYQQSRQHLRFQSNGAINAYTHDGVLTWIVNYPEGGDRDRTLHLSEIGTLDYIDNSADRKVIFTSGTKRMKYESSCADFKSARSDRLWPTDNLQTSQFHVHFPQNGILMSGSCNCAMILNWNLRIEVYKLNNGRDDDLLWSQFDTSQFYNFLGWMSVAIDGNMIVFIGNDDETNSQLIWESRHGNRGTAPYRLIMQDDCNLVMYDANNNVIWATNTVQ